MAKVRVPTAVTSVTVTGDGALSPDGNKDITCGAVNAGQLCLDIFRPKIQSQVNPSTGTQVVTMCPLITSITVNGNVYAVTNGVSATMLAADATALVQDRFWPRITSG